MLLYALYDDYERLHVLLLLLRAEGLAASNVPAFVTAPFSGIFQEKGAVFLNVH